MDHWTQPERPGKAGTEKRMGRPRSTARFGADEWRCRRPTLAHFQDWKHRFQLSHSHDRLLNFKAASQKDSITASHSMNTLDFFSHSLLQMKMIIPHTNSHYLTFLHLSDKVGRMYFFSSEVEGLNSATGVGTPRAVISLFHVKMWIFNVVGDVALCNASSSKRTW